MIVKLVYFLYKKKGASLWVNPNTAGLEFTNAGYEPIEEKVKYNEVVFTHEIFVKHIDDIFERPE